MNVEHREPVFKKRIRTILDMRNSMGPVPRNQRILSRPELTELFNSTDYEDPEKGNMIIRDAFTLYAYKQSEIADFLELHRTTISIIVSKTNK